MPRNPRDAFRGLSRSPNMVPFDILGMVSYLCAIVTLSLRRTILRYSKKCQDMKSVSEGHSTSSESTQIDLPPMISY